MRLRDKAGVTGVEYAMLLSLIAAVVIVPVISTGASLQQIFCNMGGAIGGAACADASAATTPAVQAIAFPQTSVANIGPSDQLFDTSTGSLDGVIISPAAASIYPVGPFGTSYSSTGNESIVTFGSGTDSSWGAIVDNAPALDALKSACSAGVVPAPSVHQVPAGPAGGVAIVTSIGDTPTNELDSLQYGAPTSGSSFSSTESVVTCAAPAG